MNMLNTMNPSDHKAQEKLRATTLFYIWLPQDNMIEKVGWEKLDVCISFHLREQPIHIWKTRKNVLK